MTLFDMQQADMLIEWHTAIALCDVTAEMARSIGADVESHMQQKQKLFEALKLINVEPPNDLDASVRRRIAEEYSRWVDTRDNLAQLRSWDSALLEAAGMNIESVVAQLEIAENWVNAFVHVFPWVAENERSSDGGSVH